METQFERVCVLTQNVDGFHRDAGSQNIIDIHGDINHLYCLSCDYMTVVNDYSTLDLPPRCPECNGIIRPNVVLFGEFLPQPQISKLARELEQGFDVVFSIGTTSTFPYIADPVMHMPPNAASPPLKLIPIQPASQTRFLSNFLMALSKSLSAIWSKLVE